MLRLLDQRSALPLAKITDLLFTSPNGHLLAAAIVAERSWRSEASGGVRIQRPKRFFCDHTGVELRDGAPRDKQISCYVASGHFDDAGSRRFSRISASASPSSRARPYQDTAIAESARTPG